MKRLREEDEIKEVLVSEYANLEKRKRDLLGSLKVMAGAKDMFTDKERQNIQESIDDKKTAQIEIVRVWGKLFNKDFSTSLDEILDSVYKDTSSEENND